MVIRFSAIWGNTNIKTERRRRRRNSNYTEGTICREANTVEIILNIAPATLVSRYQVCGIFHNWKHRLNSVFSTKSNAIEGVQESTSQTNGDNDLTSSEICDPNVTQVPEREERRRRCFVGGVETEVNIILPSNPTHLTRGRKHVGPTSQGSCQERKKEEKKNLWSSEIWCVGI